MQEQVKKNCGRKLEEIQDNDFVHETQSNQVLNGYAKNQGCGMCTRRFVGEGKWRAISNMDEFMPKGGRSDQQARSSIHLCRHCVALYNEWSNAKGHEDDRPRMHALCGHCYVDKWIPNLPNISRCKRSCTKKEEGPFDNLRKRLKMNGS